MDEDKKPEEQPVEPEQEEQSPPPPPEPVSPPEPVQPPTPAPAPPPPGPPPPSDTNTLIIIGWISVGIGLLGVCCCCSWLFAPLAIVLGAIAYSRGDQRGLWVLIAGIVVLIIGSGATWAMFRSHRWPEYWERFPNMPGPWRRA